MRRDDAEGADQEHSRRGVLRAMGAVGATGLVAGMAGCGGLTSRRYEAAPVVLGEEAGHLGYLLHDAGTWEHTENSETLGLDVDATLVNKYAAYRSRELNLGFFATPAVEEGDRTLNPLADRSLTGVVDSEEARSLLEQVDVGGDGGVDWRRGPERLDGNEIQFLGGSAEAAAVAGVTGDDEAVLLNIARTRHQGDVVFGVQADVRTADEERPSRPLSGDSWNLEDLWIHFGDGMGYGARVDPCTVTENLRSVRITRPDHLGSTTPLPNGNAQILDSNGNKTDETPIEQNDSGRYDGGRYVEIVLEAETSKIHGCGWVPDDYDDYRWSYRLLSNSNTGLCNQYQNGWTTIGTGDTQTVELGECDCRRGADWEIRVQGIDSSGNVVSTDSIEFHVMLNPGC